MGALKATRNRNLPIKTIGEKSSGASASATNHSHLRRGSARKGHRINQYLIGCRKRSAHSGAHNTPAGAEGAAPVARRVRRTPA
ncbi:hypothetical protein EVAR_15808_1 [Eumeta japonica]|uniref:Uncharacterized protein n=1 Tax=Eumeta variegata TaxID=151549 RepID=A0A4C1TZU7_EUMVA|nr:hypothetical protein EVAR_15808_1 [Eumeta japonica]